MATALFKYFKTQHLIAAILSCAIALHASAEHIYPDKLVAGETLLAGESIETPSGAVKLLMQNDGNLVLYRVEDFTPLWNTKSWAHPNAYVALQNDGNLVVYGPNGSPVLFNTGTFTPGSTLVLQSDNNLVLYAPDGRALWSSNTWVQNSTDPDDPDTEALPLDSGSEVASTDQKACTDDALFFRVGAHVDSSNALVNRHVLCVEQQLSNIVALKDPEGILQTNSGTVKLDAKWSIHGVHNKLEKTGTLTLGYRYTKRNDLAAPTINILAKISCNRLGDDLRVNCDKEMPMFTLTDGNEATNEVVIPLAWPDQDIIKIMTTTIQVKLFYTTDGTTPVEVTNGWTGSTSSFEPEFSSWPIRCDVNKLRKGWKGCVFPEASAVWVPQKLPSTQYARQHIADVFATMPDVPGRFRLADGKRSVAETGGQYSPLTRADPERKKLNRSTVRTRCAHLEPDPQYCAAGMRCDCDEYPPASAVEGAYDASLRSYDAYSVRKIPSLDNRKAGSQMGAMFSKERVLEGDPFWILVN
jgi:hypothetical protein